MLAAVLLLGTGGIGGWLLLRDTDRGGAEDPTAAVQAFLQAVYRDLDPARAAELVCSEARDEAAMEMKIDDIRAYEREYDSPRFRWTEPQVVDEAGELTIVSVTVTMLTGDETTADLALKVSVLDKDPDGWWVCNLEATPAEAEPTEPAEADPAE